MLQYAAFSKKKNGQMILTFRKIHPNDNRPNGIHGNALFLATLNASQLGLFCEDDALSYLKLKFNLTLLLG